MKDIPFIKMHGAGNDFVFIDAPHVNGKMTSALAERLLDRHYGIGGDQLLLLHPEAKDNSYRLEFYNADGSQAEMCGNGARAAAAYLVNERGVNRDFVFKTKRGDIGIGLRDNRIDVDMGEPILEGKKIPVNASGPIVNLALKIEGDIFRLHAVSMGNPHAVIFVEDINAVPLETWGPRLENHAFFPKRVNVEFVQVMSRSRVKARVWERGAGVTLACGTGACAIAVAAARAKLTDRAIDVDLPGGRLGVRWAENNHVFLTGPTEITFEGTFKGPLTDAKK